MNAAKQTKKPDTIRTNGNILMNSGIGAVGDKLARWH